MGGLCPPIAKGGILTQIQAVMPAEAGIQVGLGGARALDSRFRGNDEWKLARIDGQSRATDQGAQVTVLSYWRLSWRLCVCALNWGPPIPENQEHHAIWFH